MAPHRIDGKHDDVSFTRRDIDHRRDIGEFRCAREHAADEKILFIGREAQDDARSHCRWNKECPLLKPLLLGQLTRCSWLWRRGKRHSLNDIGIIQCPAA